MLRASLPVPYTAAPWLAVNPAKPSPSRIVVRSWRASCRHCGSRSGRVHCARLAALRLHCSVVVWWSVAMQRVTQPLSSAHIPAPRSRLLLSISGSIRRTSFASQTRVSFSSSWPFLSHGGMCLGCKSNINVNAQPSKSWSSGCLWAQLNCPYVRPGNACARRRKSASMIQQATLG